MSSCDLVQLCLVLPAVSSSSSSPLCVLMFAVTPSPSSVCDVYVLFSPLWTLCLPPRSVTSTEPWQKLLLRVCLYFLKWFPPLQLWSSWSKGEGCMNSEGIRGGVRGSGWGWRVMWELLSPQCFSPPSSPRPSLCPSLCLTSLIFLSLPLSWPLTHGM